jgi:Zn-finger nucleic acid-binding protein
MDGKCTVCGDIPVKSGFFNVRFEKCPACLSVYMDEDALVDFIQASMDNPAGLKHVPEDEAAPPAAGVACRSCGVLMKPDTFPCGKRLIRFHKCAACRQILLHPADLFRLNEAVHEEKRRLFQDALTGT